MPTAETYCISMMDDFSSIALAWLGVVVSIAPFDARDNMLVGIGEHETCVSQ